MKSEAARSHDQVAKIRDEEHPVMAVFETVVHALEGKEHEQKVGEGVHDFGRVMGRIVY